MKCSMKHFNYEKYKHTMHTSIIPIKIIFPITQLIINLRKLLYLTQLEMRTTEFHNGGEKKHTEYHTLGHMPTCASQSTKGQEGEPGAEILSAVLLLSL